MCCWKGGWYTDPACWALSPHLMPCLGSRWKVLLCTTSWCQERNIQLMFPGVDLCWCAAGQKCIKNYDLMKGLPARPLRGSRNKQFSPASASLDLATWSQPASSFLSVIFSSAQQHILRNPSGQGQSPVQAGEKEWGSSEIKVCRQHEHRKKCSTSKSGCNERREVKK